jgi:hypothetical protein
VDRSELVRRFNTLYFGDSLLQVLELRTGEAECALTFNGGSALKHEGASIFDPEVRFVPAVLRFKAVRSIACEGAGYQLNSTVVDFGASEASAPDYIEFFFDLTGGTDAEAFIVKLKIMAKDFQVGSLAR